MVKKLKEKFEPDKFMKMAIDAMRLSVDEPRKDGKVSPKVGAVLLKKNGEIQSAYRGELRFGDHAEFTLLERKNRSALLDGSILFATLEPCAPGARKHPKLGCAERIVNARIKEVWIGIEDPDPDVDRKGIKYLEDNGITVYMFYPEYQKIIREENSEFLAQALVRAKKSNTMKELALSVMEDIDLNADINIFSDKAINCYIEKSGLTYKFNSDDLWSHFERIGIVKRTNKHGKYIYKPTGIGILLFGSEPREKYQHAVVKAKVKYGDDSSIPKDFEGPLVLIPSEIELWLKQILHSEISRKQFERKTDTLFPLEPLREAIINALAHRDYGLTGAKTFIEIDDDNIVVKSAGLPVSPISLEDVKEFRAPSLSRNPKITYILSKMGLMEESELGMETFRGMQDKYGLPLPLYSYKAPYLSLTFPRNIEASKLFEGHEFMQSLNNEEILGLNWIKSKKIVTAVEYSQHFSFNSKKSQRHLAKLVNKGLIKLKGRGKYANYEYISK